MKTLDEIIHERRSIRRYEADKKVPREIVEQLIAAAILFCGFRPLCTLNNGKI